MKNCVIGDAFWKIGRQEDWVAKGQISYLPRFRYK